MPAAPTKPLFQAFTLSGLPNTNLPASRYNGVALPTLPGYTSCVYEDRAWRADPKNPRDFSGFGDWAKSLPERAVALIDLEPLAELLDVRRPGFDVQAAIAASQAISEARTRDDIELYGYGLPFTAWTPTTRPRTDALAAAAAATAVANQLATLGVVGRSVLRSLSGVLVSLYVPWTPEDPNAAGLYWQRFIRRTAAWCRDLLAVQSIGCLCPTYVHTPPELSPVQSLLPLERWREAVAAVADEFDGGAVWYAPTVPYSPLRLHIDTAAQVWRQSVSRNDA